MNRRGLVTKNSLIVRLERILYFLFNHLNIFKMKKKNLKLLKLSKKSISNLDSGKVNGGLVTVIGCVSAFCSESCNSIDPRNCFVRESDLTCECGG